MINSLQNDVTILNIFKDELEFAKGFIDYHHGLVHQMIMVNTGNHEVYEQIRNYSKQFKNVLVFFSEFERIDFSAFRNEALSKFDGATKFVLWLDTDEVLEFESNDFYFDENTDVGGIVREDGSKLFSTELDRLFRSTLSGSWVNTIHEHFRIDGNHVKETIRSLKIQHLTSESQRSERKKVMYFEILVDEYQKATDRQAKINALQHIIVMASHDFKNPQLCIDFFEANKDLIFSLNTEYEISKVQKMNILLHAMMSYSRLAQPTGLKLISSIEEIDKSKSTYFQILRALAFNQSLADHIKSLYQEVYPTLTIDTNGEFNNLDFQKEKEINWLERKIGLQQ